jgi:hypothetical protein
MVIAPRCLHGFETAGHPVKRQASVRVQDIRDGEVA